MIYCSRLEPGHCSRPKNICCCLAPPAASPAPGQSPSWGTSQGHLLPASDLCMTQQLGSLPQGQGAACHCRAAAPRLPMPTSILTGSAGKHSPGSAWLYQRLVLLELPLGWIHAGQLEDLLWRERAQRGEPASAAPAKSPASGRPRAGGLPSLDIASPASQSWAAPVLAPQAVETPRTNIMFLGELKRCPGRCPRSRDSREDILSTVPATHTISFPPARVLGSPTKNTPPRDPLLNRSRGSSPSQTLLGKSAGMVLQEESVQTPSHPP